MIVFAGGWRAWGVVIPGTDTFRATGGATRAVHPSAGNMIHRPRFRHRGKEIAMIAKLMTCLGLTLLLTLTAATGEDAAMSLAKQVVNASGGGEWGKVSH